MDLGYKRVSSINQSTDRQLDGIDLDKVFEDYSTGGNRNRPALDRLMDHIREGDAIHVHSIDRLARNLIDLMSLITLINEKGASIQFHTEKMSFTGLSDPLQTLQLQVMGAVAQFERAIVNERAAEGRALAVSRGVKFGRKPLLSKSQVLEVRRQRESGKPVSKIALDMDCSRPSIYRALARR